MKKYLITLIFLSSVLSSFALTDTVKNTFGLNDLIANTTLIKSGSSKTVTGSRFVKYPITATKPDFTLENSLGVIELSILKNFKLGTVPVATPTVTLTVTSWVLNNNGKALNQSTEDVILSLDVNASKPVLRTYWLKKNAHQFNIIVKSISGFPANGWEQLELNTSVITNSYSQFPSLLNYNLRHETTLTDGNLNVKWDAISGAERYELEWTYVSGRNASKDNDISILLPSQLTIDGSLFANNSTRVIVKNTNFDIPMIYEEGYILYRIRAISKKYFGTTLQEYRSFWSNGETMTNRTLGSWKSGTNPNYYLYNGLENLKNWQSSISFAEEGKTKTVVTYHDGSMRNRQAVTRINSDNRTIVGETLYDYAGRPVIQLLPVPTNSGSLSFVPNFNIIDTKNGYIMKEDYIKNYTSTSCVPSAPEFAIESGASGYYSSSGNKFINLEDGVTPSRDKIINRDLIPNAEKYPYTQTEYTLDNTGRVNAQSGVGKNHILGKGHETKYLYSTPTQDELTRLFGTQVGNASHYKKNIVIDANGQVSTSYLDLDGKVIATYLTGEAPDNLTDLESINNTVHADELLIGSKSNLLNAEGTQKTMTYNVAVASKGTAYEFKYKADAQTIDVNCDPTSSTTKQTFDGALKAELTLVDKCKTNLIDVKDASKSGQTGIVQKLNLNSKVTLDKGEYTLTKTLSVDEKAIDALWEKYLADPNTNCLKTEKTFIEAKEAELKLKVDCEFTCATCKAMKSDLEASDPNNKELGLLNQLCDNICKENYNPCKINLDALKADMSPGGQYGLIRSEQAMLPDNAGPQLDANGKIVTQKPQMTINTQGGAAQKIDPSPFPLSVFNVNNALSSQIKVKISLVDFDIHPSWKTPIQVNFDGKSDVLNDLMWNTTTLTKSSKITYAITDYYNSDKSLAFVKVVKKVNGTIVTYTPELDVNGISYFEEKAGTNTKEFNIPVKYLKNFEDFEKLWQPGWGAYLVPFHPEFKYYLNCITNTSVFTFENKLMNCSTLSQALDDKNKFITPTSASDGYTSLLLTKDPLLNSSVTWVNNYMNYKSTNYNSSNSMIQMATSMARCPNGITYQDACSAASSNCVDNKLVSDEDWIMYRNLYIGERQKILKRLVNEESAAGFYYNGCIGHPDYLQSPDADAFKRPFHRTELGTKQVKICRYWGLYCTTKTVQYSSPALKLPYLIDNQPCFQGNADLYAKKIQHYFPTTSVSSNSGFKVDANCGTTNTYTYKDMSGNDVTETISEPCSSDVAKTIQTIQQNSASKKYNECGLCPIASDLQSFMVQLFDTKMTVGSTNQALFYQSSPLQVNCSSSIVKVPSALEDIFKVTGQTTTPEITWKAELFDDKKRLEGELLSGTKKFKITLALPTPSTTNGLKTGIDLDALLNICCLDIDRTVAGTTNKFFLKANYIDIKEPLYSTSTTDNPDPLTTKVVYLNGTITLENLALDIDNCTFPPQCALSDKANSLVSFLNTLALQMGSGSSIIKQSHLLAPAPVTLCSPDAKDVDNTLLYITSLRQIFPTLVGTNTDIDSYKPTWDHKIVGNTVKGEIQYNDNGNQILNINVDFGNSGYTFDPNNFVEFTNVETDASNQLNMKAQVKYKVISNNIVSYQYAPVTISASITLSVCKAVTRPNNVTPK